VGINLSLDILNVKLLAGSFYLEDMWDFMILVEIYVLLDDASGF
jgi:hypothetical protein